MVSDILSNPFLTMALLAGLAASVTSGIMGTFVVIKRIVFISGSISHSVLGGMGLALWLQRTYDIAWLTPLQGAIVAALLSALLIGWIHLNYREREDTVIAALWSTGMSLGVIFIALTPGYNVELIHYLFGNILWVSQSDLQLLLGLDAIVLIAVLFLRQPLIAICFDETQAYMQKIPVKLLYILLLCLVALSVVLLIQVVGSILVIALLAIPAAVASSATHRLSLMLLLSVAFGALFTLLGITVSYQLNWPPGATIALVATAFYLASLAAKKRKLVINRS
jgi:zinc transport system permease protein